MSQPHTEQGLLQKIALLPREIAPVNDPWPKISVRLSADSAEVSAGVSRGRATRAQPTHLRPFAVAASLLLVSATVWLLQQSWNSPSPLPANLPPAEGLTAASEAEYQAAFKEFMASGAAHVSSAQQSIEAFGAGWGELRRAEFELKVALNAEPDNLFLNSHMQSLRARQLDLLQQISAVNMTSRRNTI
jgi:hypothetical protein